MLTQPVPRDQWTEFLDEYSRGHLGRVVDVIVLDPVGSIGMEAQRLPLAGIATERHNGGGLEISLGEGAERHLAHRIEEPVHLCLIKAPETGDETLEIRSESGMRTLVHVRPEEGPPPL